MKLKPYPEYEDSGIEWIGEIPDGWEMRKLKFISRLFGRIGFRGYTVSDLVEEGKGALTIGGKHISKNQKLDLSSPEYLSWEKYKESPEIMIEQSNILITQRGTLGKVVLIDKDIGPATINPSMILIKEIKLLSEYLYYFLVSDFSIQEVALINSQTAVPMISQEQADNFHIIFPRNEQDQTIIASFLDKKTAKIDTLIEKDKKLIALLKEKRTALINHAVTKGLDPNVKLNDSGIQWIDKIPEDAKIMPFRRVCYVNQGLQFPEDERLSEPDEKSKIYITIKYIHADEDGVKEYIPNPPRSVICKKEDVLLARTGATGEVITNQEGVFHNNFFKVNYNSKIDRDYLVYYLKMDSIKKVLLLKAGVTTIPDLNHDAFLSTPFILYSIEKQKQIAGYLDKRTAKIDKTIKLIEKKVKLLEEYKKSLVHHVVTGKVDVRKSEV